MSELVIPDRFKAWHHNLANCKRKRIVMPVEAVRSLIEQIAVLEAPISEKEWAAHIRPDSGHLIHWQVNYMLELRKNRSKI